MPAQILHTLFGEEVIIEIGKQIHPQFDLVAKKVLEKIQGIYRNIFILGCQGPDIFYHSQMTRPVALEYGTLLHRRGFGDFTSALCKAALPDHVEWRDGYPQEKKLTPLSAYALGFMTHAFLDRLTHPYIVYKSSVVSPATDKTIGFMKTFPRGTAHAFFERILDVLMLDILQGKPVASWDQDVLAAVCAEPPRGLKELLFKTLGSVFPERAGKDQKLFQRIENTLRDCGTFYRLTDPGQTSLKCRISTGEDHSSTQKIPLVYLYPEQLPLSIDYLNLGGQPWYYPIATGKEDQRSFLEIYHEAVKTAGTALSEIIAPYLETGIFPVQETAQILGNDGLSIKDETGKPCIPNRVGTLPLDEVLVQQGILRTRGR
jgi:hypothetical protein